MLLSYDGDDRLTKVITEENGQVTSTVTYAYDADGNRIQTNADGQVTQYVVDSNDSLSQVVAELNQDNQVKVAYLYGDDLVSQYRENKVNYYHYDGLGSTRVLTDNSGASTDSYDYEAFGELLAQSGNTENNYLYTGEQIDPNTGNYYLRARYYNPEKGRFLSMDNFDGLAQNPITLHKYLYGNADPVNKVDPSGHFSLGSLNAGQAVSGILNAIYRLDKVLNILDVVMDPTGAVTKKLTNKAMGALVLLSRAGKQAPYLSRLFSSKKPKKCKNSFTTETLVHTQRGLVAIEEVQIGDLVWSYDENTGQTQFNEVIHLLQGQQEYDLISLTLESGEVIESTPEHPFYIKGKGWNPASSLKVGQALLLRSGTVVVIQEISTETRFETVYNLTVANTHNYFVGQDGVLVQNCKEEVKVDAKIFAQTLLLNFHIGMPILNPPDTCYLVATAEALDPKYLMTFRAILTMLDNVHVVLGVGNTLESMVVIDKMKFNKRFGGPCAPMKTYRENVKKKRKIRDPRIKIEEMSQVKTNIDKLKRGDQY